MGVLYYKNWGLGVKVLNSLSEDTKRISYRGPLNIQFRNVSDPIVCFKVIKEMMLCNTFHLIPNDMFTLFSINKNFVSKEQTKTFYLN